MISIDFNERSTWRAVGVGLTGIASIWFLAPVVFALASATTTEQVMFLAQKSVAIGAALIGVGQTWSGFIGLLFKDTSG